MERQRRVEAAVGTRRPIVDEALKGAVPVAPPENLYGASRHLLDAGGKRLRPTILLLVAETLAGLEAEGPLDGATDGPAAGDTDTPPDEAAYRACPDVNGNEVDVLSAAVSIEVVQSFTLIHDDIMDDDDMRRGVPAVHREYSDEMAILAGDTLYARAFELLLGTGATPDRALRGLTTLARTCTDICEGQAMDISFEDQDTVSVDEYLEMVELKTAVLFATAASLPAILLGHDGAIEPLAEYGRDIGRAFQIQDDLLDLTTSTEELGKQRGSDLIEGKQTLVTVHAREQGVDVDTLVPEGDSVTEADIGAAVDELDRAGSLDYARETALEYVENGTARLDVLPDTASRERLADIAAYLVERDY